MTDKKRPSSKPLIPGGNNYPAMHLIFTPESVQVKPSRRCYIFAGLLLLPALALAAVPVLTGRLLGDGDPFFWVISVVTLLFSIGLIYQAVRIICRIRRRCRGRFNLLTRTFYPEGGGPAEPDREKFPAIPFAELTALQIVEEHCSAGKSSFDSCELNVVLRDGRRFNLLDHSGKECFAEEAEELAGILAIPLTDAKGQRISADAFLQLPAGIRTNLLCGAAGVLIAAVFFALGDGHSWYLTGESRRWKQTQATVASASVREHGGKHTRYSPDLRYVYHYQGRKYTGKRYSFFAMRASEYAVKNLLRQYPPGRKFCCYVNPRAPEQSVVDRQTPPVWEMLLNSPWTLCFLLMGLGCLLQAAAQYRLLCKRRRRSGR